MGVKRIFQEPKDRSPSRKRESSPYDKAIGRAQVFRVEETLGDLIATGILRPAEPEQAENSIRGVHFCGSYT